MFVCGCHLIPHTLTPLYIHPQKPYKFILVLYRTALCLTCERDKKDKDVDSNKYNT